MSDDETPQHKTLREALHAVMLEVGYVHKSQTAPKAAGGFRYASDADVIKAVRPALLQHGVIGPIPVEVVHADVKTYEGSKQKHRVTVRMRYKFVHVHSGEELQIETVGQGADSTDKAPYKALTGAFKYAIRETLMLETGDDPEAGDAEDRSNAPDQQQLNDAHAAGALAGREFVIRQLYDKASIHDDFDGRALASELKRRELPSLSDLKHFVLWLGRPKLASLPTAKVNELMDWLETDKGRRKFNEFVKACGIQ